jgi:hypothetical protein
MLFNIEADTGDKVTGYVVPDGFSEVPSIRASCDGEEILVFSANEIRESLVAAGRHETGTCGFTLDSTLVAGLPELANLQLFHADSDLLIYRRPQPHAIRKKILRLETHLFPLWRLDCAFGVDFQYFANGVEQLGRETVTQLFLLNQVESIFLSGRILYKNYAYFIEPEFQTVLILQDPYHELAERLLVLSKIRGAGRDQLGLRDSLCMRSAIDFAASLPFQDAKGLRRAMRYMPADVAAALANPLVRQLTATTPDEMPGPGAVAASLDLLSSFAIVEFRDRPENFVTAFGQFLEVDSSSLSPIPQFPAVAPLADLLKNAGEIEALLEKDLELYHHVVEAFAKSRQVA